MAATIAVTKETRFGETRIAATPETVKKLIALGYAVTVEAGAGLSASIPDAEFEAAGASLAKTAKQALANADIVLKVRGPSAAEIAGLKSGTVVIALMNAYNDPDMLAAMAAKGVTGFAMEFVPRITRAQVMDALSSQANLAGYRAVIEGAEAYGRVLPMMMTAAGTASAAKVFTMGVGVAGLQPIAPTRRLGAWVPAHEERPGP